MGSLIGGLIILGIVTGVLFIIGAPLYTKIGNFISNKIKPFKGEDE